MIPRRGYRRGYGRQPGLAMLLLAGQLMQVGFNRIPPVTLATIVGQVVIFLNPMRIRLPGVREVCVSGVNVWYKEEWQRLFTAAFFHLNEWHLYYNMVSFLWKGLGVERKLGSSYFVYMIAVFAVVSSGLTVCLSLLLEQATGNPSYLSDCAAGFSGVLFALKVVTTQLMPRGMQRIMGLFPVPSRIACWVELLVIHILVPNSSFTGHLAGIFTGLLYVKGPLKYLMDQLHSPGPSYAYHWGTTSSRSRGNVTFNYSGTTGGGRSTQQQDVPADNRYSNINRDYSNYTAGLSEDEQLSRATQESLYMAYTQQRPEPTAPRAEDGASPESASPTLAPSRPPSQAPTPHNPTLPPSYARASAPPPNDDSPESGSANRMYPDLSAEARAGTGQNTDTNDLNDLRQRRLARFEKR